MQISEWTELRNKKDVEGLLKLLKQEYARCRVRSCDCMRIKFCPDCEFAYLSEKEQLTRVAMYNDCMAGNAYEYVNREIVGVEDQISMKDTNTESKSIEDRAIMVINYPQQTTARLEDMKAYPQMRLHSKIMSKIKSISTALHKVLSTEDIPWIALALVLSVTIIGAAMWICNPTEFFNSLQRIPRVI